MTWYDLLFAHWPLEPAALRPLIPRALELETFNGAAWLGIVPFRMRNVGLYGLPKPPWLSAFDELNVRTYVHVGDRPGVFFFSLDAANRVAVAAARHLVHLPYFNARMAVGTAGEWIDYRSQRHHRGFPGGEFRGRYRPAGPVYHSLPGTLEHWLTERYCLYAIDPKGRPSRLEIQHLQWPLQPAEAEIAVNTVADAHGIVLPEESPLVHFARRIDVLAWRPVPAGSSMEER